MHQLFSTQISRLAGKVALITGGASGIGKATAAEFIREGAKVVLADVQHELGRAAAAELGPDAAFVGCDVADESQVSAAVDFSVAAHGRLDVVYNNAGVVGPVVPSIVDLDLAGFDRIMAVNVRGVMAGIKHAARVMVPRRSGCILCTASIAGVTGGSAHPGYAISKFAVAGAVRSAAAELCGHGVRVNAISPYVVMTPMTVKGFREMMPGADDGRVAEAVKRRGVLKGAVCEAVDVARAAVYLASEDAQYVSGHNLVVDGGFTAFKGRGSAPAPASSVTQEKGEAEPGQAEATLRLASMWGRPFSRPRRRHGGDSSICRFLTTQGGRLAGKVALITGAASGVGRATANEFVREGAKVVLADVQHQLGQEAAAELGPDASFVGCDVADESQVSAAVDFAVAAHGRLDVVYNNAGIAGSLTPSIVDLDLADFDRTMAVNIRGVVAGIKHAARVMVPRRSGCIICTASVAGVLGGVAPHGYSVSKFAVAGAVRSAAAELCGHGVRVNAISPYVLMTPFSVNAMRELFPGVEDRRLVEAVHGGGELKGAVCEEVDVARAAVYLASEDAKYVSGHNLVVDGGFTAFKRFALADLT